MDAWLLDEHQDGLLLVDHLTDPPEVAIVVPHMLDVEQDEEPVMLVLCGLIKEVLMEIIQFRDLDTIPTLQLVDTATVATVVTTSNAKTQDHLHAVEDFRQEALQDLLLVLHLHILVDPTEVVATTGAEVSTLCSLICMLSNIKNLRKRSMKSPHKKNIPSSIGLTISTQTKSMNRNTRLGMETTETTVAECLRIIKQP